MTMTIKARYCKGKLEPLEELELQEGKEVTVTISDMADSGRAAFLKLSMKKRRAILASQAAEIAETYLHDRELADVGGGDIVDY